MKARRPRDPSGFYWLQGFSESYQQLGRIIGEATADGHASDTLHLDTLSDSGWQFHANLVVYHKILQTLNSFNRFLNPS